MTDCTKENFAELVENNKGTVLIDLYATWCAPCRMLAPTVEELESEYPTVTFLRIDVDREPELAAQFGVSSIPMIAIVKDGTFTDFSVGLVPKSKLVSLIEANQ